MGKIRLTEQLKHVTVPILICKVVYSTHLLTFHIFIVPVVPQEDDITFLIPLSTKGQVVFHQQRADTMSRIHLTGVETEINLCPFYMFGLS